MNVFSRKPLRSGVFSMAVAVSVAVGGLGLLATPTPAYAIYCANCSTFYQQMFQYAKDVETALNTAQQLQTQIQQYNNMVQQGMRLPDRMFNSVTGSLQQVANVYNNARSLDRNISNLDSKFRQQFPGYDSYLQSTGSASSVMPGRYETWSAEGLDNARTAMQAAGMNVSTFADEDSMLSNLVSRSQSAVGRQQAIQAGNEISAQNVQQLQKLRDLLATQITMQGNYMAQETERQSIDDAFRHQFRSGEVHGTGASKEY